MELDDLRRQWQQPEQADVPPPQLAGLLDRSPGGLIDQMRHNTWYEIIAAPIIGLLPLPLALETEYRWVYLALMLPLLIILGFYYARQLRLLRRMSQTDASLHQHLQVLCQGLRRLLTFYYRLTYWTAMPTFLLLLSYIAWKELYRSTDPRWLALGLMMGLGLLLGAWLQWGILRLTRQYLQRLYGRHLDRLEGQLRELEEEAPAAGPLSI